MSAQHASSSTPNGRRVVWTGAGMPASDGAGVKLLRVLGQPALPDLDPFLMLDAFGSDDPDAYMAGFPSHPHRGFETVTYMLAGRMRHRDNKGNEGLLQPGSVQWMTAGRGILHSEMPEQEEGLMQGFQLWINLPAADKMTEPRYQDIQPDRIPVVHPADGVTVKVLAGEAGRARGPVDAGKTAPLYIDVTLASGAVFEPAIPAGYNAFLYAFEGVVEVGEGADPVAAGKAAVLSLGDHVVLRGGPEGGRLILIAGQPLREPVVKYGPFVMNTAQEIHQAVADYNAGKF